MSLQEKLTNMLFGRDFSSDIFWSGFLSLQIFFGRAVSSEKKVANVSPRSLFASDFFSDNCLCFTPTLFRTLVGSLITNHALRAPIFLGRLEKIETLFSKLKEFSGAVDGALYIFINNISLLKSADFLRDLQD